MMFKKFLLCIPVLLLFCAAKQFNRMPGYDLAKPDKVLILPDTLREISGCTYLNESTFACVQDENGILFIYNVVKNKIESQHNFHIDGDYEGVTHTGEKMFILRSDGVLFAITNLKEKPSVKSYSTGIPASNNEGLCYDKDNNRLLIAAKGKIGKGKEYLDKRVIYSFDLNTYKLDTEPAFDFDLKKIREFAVKQKLPLETRSKKNGAIAEPVIRFNTSAICIHPVTKKLYLLSASDHLLFIFDMKGDLLNMALLDPNIFNKPEGITFNENGDMLITNEGQDKKPTALIFRYSL
ncbi:MAG: hypothetical protein JWO44_1178 [Bacteroidetes bacterium]|nr:hypothetical protein [Bacteroidota bacterium]